MAAPPARGLCGGKSEPSAGAMADQDPLGLVLRYSEDETVARFERGEANLLDAGVNGMRTAVESGTWAIRFHRNLLAVALRAPDGPNKEDPMTSAIGDAESVDLNSASAEELDRIGGLERERVDQIIKSRSFSSWSDLQRAEGFGGTL